jgi:hypothetical protein
LALKELDQRLKQGAEALARDAEVVRTEAERTRRSAQDRALAFRSPLAALASGGVRVSLGTIAAFILFELPQAHLISIGAMLVALSAVGGALLALPLLVRAHARRQPLLDPAPPFPVVGLEELLMAGIGNELDDQMLVEVEWDDGAGPFSEEKLQALAASFRARCVETTANGFTLRPAFQLPKMAGWTDIGRAALAWSRGCVTALSQLHAERRLRKVTFVDEWAKP